MKNIKEMIISILLGFTLVISIYSTIKISELEDDISDLDSDISDLESQIYELSYLEDELSSMKQTLRLNGIFIR